MEIFELVEVTPEQVIVKVNAKGLLTIARNPFLQANYKYINVTRGEQHILTVIRSDGTTFSWTFGKHKNTLIDGNSRRLTETVMKFLADNHVLMDVHFDKPETAEIFYNNNYKCWQINYIYSKETQYIPQYDLTENNDKGFTEAKNRAKFFGFTEFAKKEKDERTVWERTI